MEAIKELKSTQHLIKPIAFEHFLIFLFENLGYDVVYQKRRQDKFIDIELTYKKTNQKYIGEIKFFSKLQHSLTLNNSIDDVFNKGYTLSRKKKNSFNK